MQRGREWLALRLVVVGTDTIAIALAFGLAWAITLLAHDGATTTITRDRVAHLVIYIVGWMLLLAAYHLYDIESVLDGFLQYERIAHASTTGLLLLVGILALLEGDALIPRALLLLSWLLSVIFLGSSRFIMRRIVRHLRQRGFFRARTLIVGAGEDGVALADQISASARASTDIVGFLDEYMAKGTVVQGFEVLGEPLELAHIAQSTGATEAILVPQAISWESLKVLIESESASWGLQRLWLAPAIRDLLTTGMEVHRRGSLPLLAVTGLRISGLEALLKRGLDLVVALLLLPVVVPLCLVITLWLVAVRRVNPIARRQMIGDGRRRFTMYTFPPENVLRQLHVWRLPALFNVIGGDLSLVGPRPIASALAERYREWSSMLACVRPGLTGPWWLLSGTRKLSIDAEVADDLSYIRNYSIWLDVHILIRTLGRLTSRIQITDLDQGEVAGQTADVVSPTRAIVP